MPWLLLCAFLFVPSVAQRIFASFSCDAFKYDDATNEFHFYLHEDYAIQCYTPEHDGLIALSSAFILMWPIGVPALFAMLLSAARRHGLRGVDETRLATSVEFLTGEYKPEFYYW